MAYSANEVSGNYNPAAAPPGWSFGDPVPPQSRWLDAVDAVQQFLELLEASNQDERVSMSSYSDRAKTDVNLMSNYLETKQAMSGYSKKFNSGATNIGDGILAGASALGNKKHARSWASRVMIVLTDGIHNIGTDPLIAAKKAAAQNIQIYTVTFSSEADVASMQKVAAAGSGKHFHALNGSQLADAFDEIARSLPTLITY